MSKNKRNTTQQGVLSNDEVLGSTFDHESDAAEAFLNRWEDKDQEPSSDTQGKEEVVTEEETAEEESQEEQAITEDTEAETEEESEDEAEEDSDEEEETTEEEQDQEEDEEGSDDDESDDTPTTLKDNAEVEVKVNGEVKRVPVKELTRLYGKEAAITQKEQKVAAQRKEVEAQATKYAASLDALYEKAKARWEPYSKIDMLLASKELDTDQFAELRKNAQEAYEEFQFVSQEAQKFVEHTQQVQQQRLQAEAAEAVKVLKDKVPNWSNDLYDKIRTYTIENGIPADLVNKIVDPHAIMLLNKARLYDESKKIKLKTKAKTPKKVLKAAKAPADFTVDKSKGALDKLRMSGDTEDAAEAFLSRWST